MAKYTTKGTDGLAENWVSGSRSGWHAAFTWLTRCQHSTAQMVATLTRTPLVRYSCRTTVILVPTPDVAVTNDLVRKNLSCCLRSADISFASWCREYRTNIEAPRPHEVKVRGGTACAFQVTSFFKDSYFGQWLVMNVPANMTSFSKSLVSRSRSATFAGSQYAYLLRRPEEWRSLRWIRSESTLRGWRPYLVDSTVAYFQALIETCDLYLSSQLAGGHLSQRTTPPISDLSCDQREAFQVGQQYLRSDGHHPPYAITGNAGTGKSYVVSLLIEATIVKPFDLNGMHSCVIINRIYRQLRCPTRPYCSTMEFSLWTNFVTLETIDSIILMTSRKSIDGMCKIILAGDFSQLEPPDNSKSCESNRFWSHSILLVPIKDTCKMLVVTYAETESVSKCFERLLDQ